MEGIESQLNWLWEDKIQVPIILISMALVCIGVYYYGKFKMSNE